MKKIYRKDFESFIFEKKLLPEEWYDIDNPKLGMKYAISSHLRVLNKNTGRIYARGKTVAMMFGNDSELKRKNVNIRTLLYVYVYQPLIQSESLKNEEWKVIDGFEDYSVSSQGNVKNNKTNNILRYNDNGYGYRKVVLTIQTKHYTKKIHRLVGETFIDNPHNHPYILHISTDKTDNSVNNLYWSDKKGSKRHESKI